MKKLILSILATALFLSACGQTNTSTETISIEQDNNPATAYYNDWDRAVRIDVDMQNMFVSTPNKIEKPIDLYMAMALSLKYNYSRRLISYEDSVIRAGLSPVNRLPEIVSNAGYINDTNSDSLSPDLKVTWNILDLTLVYCQSQNKDFTASVAYEETRKVIHNILQETRTLYWKTLIAQKLIPVVDNMIEFMTLEVDEIYSQEIQLSKTNGSLDIETLVKKRKYMESIKELSSTKRSIQTAQTRLASLMGFHPSTEFRLVGSEYGNFDLPKIKSNLSHLEWLALNNRPELREHDIATSIDRLKIVTKDFKDPGLKQYKSDPEFYNQMWSRQAREIGMSVFEDVANPSLIDLENLRRQRISSIILSQVYVSWAQYIMALEDYQIDLEIASTSENIAEDFTLAVGSQDAESQFEAARAIEDEIKAFKSYADLQESLGNLYSTIGLDAVPYFMLNEKPSQIAVYLRRNLEKWSDGKFLPDNRPYLLNIPSKRPPVNMSSTQYLPDMVVESGKTFTVEVDEKMFERADFEGETVSKAGLVNDAPLPQWLDYDEEKSVFVGTPMPGSRGTYNIKIYFSDANDTIAYATFKIKVIENFVPGMSIKGQSENSSATVLRRCINNECGDDYIDANFIGENVTAGPQ